jgi:hypothetical protein
MNYGISAAGAGNGLTDMFMVIPARIAERIYWQGNK